MAKYNPTFTDTELQQETWESVVGYKGFYDVSNLGRVRRIRYTCKGCGLQDFYVLQPRPQSKKIPYLRVTISKDGIETYDAIAIMVLEAFTGPKPTPNHTANHKDGDKQNNRLSNLDWLSKSEQIQHAIEMGLRPRIMGIAERSRKVTPNDVLAIRKSTKTNRELAEIYPLSREHISGIRNRRFWKHVE
jgi:hypothetical protein